MTEPNPMTVADLPLSRTLHVGNMKVHALEAGLLWLDGGAMFGVVPRTLWERRCAPDDRHRIPLAARCLLVEAGELLVVVDTGVGNKESEKFMDIYGVENAGVPTRLEEAIRSLGYGVEDVDLVVNTHLHFDHAGGNVVLGEGGTLEPAFPNARYVMNERELEFAASPNERVRASYMARNHEPLVDAGLVDLVDGPGRIVEGIRVEPTPGHTPFHQSVVLESQGETAIFLADLCPTSAHLPLPWIMGYDLEPLVTLETKRAVLGRAREEGWILVFQHDPHVPWGRLDPEAEKPRLVSLEKEQDPSPS